MKLFERKNRPHGTIIWMYFGFDICPSVSFSSPCFGSFIVHQFFDDSVQVVKDSYLQSFFYNVAYEVASMIDYSNQGAPGHRHQGQPSAQANLPL